MAEGKRTGRSGQGNTRTVAESLQEYGRGVVGGLIFSLPLFYTMEVWWAGLITRPWKLLAYVVATFVLLLGYNRYAGLRRDASMAEVAIDSVEELGIGFLISTLLLFLLGRITFDMATTEVVGRIVIEAMMGAIGVSVGTSQLGGASDADDRGFAGDEPQQRGQGDEEVHFGGQLVIAFCGAVLFAANVGPTEEIVVIATEISSWHVLALALVSLLVGALILHFSEFTGAEAFVRRENFSSVVFETVTTYAVALVASVLILFFFGRFDGEALITCLAQTVVLGVAATLGASAGRLLLQ